MKKETNSEALQRVKGLNGKVKGSCTRAIFDYLKTKVGPDKIEKIKKQIVSYGYEENIETLSPIAMYPVDFELAVLFSIQDVLEWGEEEIKELGRNVPKLSFIIKFFANYLVSTKVGYEKSDYYWQKHFDIGKIEMPELNEEEKYFVVHIKDFDIHPIYCIFLEGYTETMSNFFVGSKKDITCKERKCTFSSPSPHHEFIIKWS